MFEHRRVKLMTDVAEVIGKSLGALTKVEDGSDEHRRLRRRLAGQHSKFDCEHRQLLIEAIM